jgi:hypothetical protein
VTFGSISIFSVIAVKFIRIEFGKRSERYSAEVLYYKKKFDFTKRYSTYIAKEWLDMKRSRTLYPIVGAYIGPLIFLSVIFWFLRTVLALPLDFNIIFYSAMIGFFGMTIYSWLNVLDNPAFYQVLPVGVPLLIRTKLVLFFLLSFAISTGFIIILGIMNNELHLLWLALLVAFTTTSYTVIATAYITGLRTKSYLFSPKILGKFMAVVALPLIFLTIMSFLIDDNFFISMLLISGICALLILALFVMFKGIDKKWAGESFVF